MQQQVTAPAAPDGRPGPRFRLSGGLLRIVAISLVALVAYIAIYATVQYQLRKSVNTEVRLATAVGRLRYLDEALTMSARLGAATGDQSYEARYNQLASELDDVLAETLALAPAGADLTGLQSVDQANKSLIAQEERAFALARQGRTAEALAAVTSDEYLRNKRVYSNGTDAAFASILGEERAAVQRWELFGNVSGIVAVIALLISIVVIARSVQQQQLAQSEAITLAAQATVTAQEQSAQNAELQRQIVHLLEEVSDVAEGDLTVQAEVTEGSLGAVADSFNYMITELRQVIGRVNNATQQVGNSTDEILATTDVLSRSAEQQASRVADTSTAVEEMAVSIQQVSENAALSARVAREARASAEAGTQAVAATIAGMARVQQQVQETARKIERLAASSQEIDKIVGLIRDVADQTQVLALNAAIQAAAAGEHGRGFAVVAEEVRRLAQRTTVASGQIATLVKGIQAETGEAIAAMEEGHAEVSSGAQVAEEAGQRLGQIDTTAVQLAELIEAISLAAEQQARASAGIARAMGEISTVTTSTSAGTQQAAASVAALATLADDLRSSVAAFRLTTEPSGRGQAARGGVPTAGHGAGRLAYAGTGD